MAAKDKQDGAPEVPAVNSAGESAPSNAAGPVVAK